MTSRKLRRPEARPRHLPTANAHRMIPGAPAGSGVPARKRCQPISRETRVQSRLTALGTRGEPQPVRVFAAPAGRQEKLRARARHKTPARLRYARAAE